MNLSRQLRRSAVIAIVTVLVVALAAAASTAQPKKDEPEPPGAALRTPFQLVDDRDVNDRLPQPEDRYALASGCYTIEAPGHGFVVQQGTELRLDPEASAAEPFHFQATRLGEYLIATNEGRDTSYEGAWWDVRGYVSASTVVPPLDLEETGLPARRTLPAAPRPPLLTTGDVNIANEPSDAADWRIVAAGPDPDAKVTKAKGKGQQYVISLPATGDVLAVEGDALTLVESGAEAAEFRFHHVASGVSAGTTCPVWPEIELNTSGPPAPVKGNPAQEVQGFFESHVHGMAFEFLGGDLRCGRPWHPYGVEYALGDCYAEGNTLNSVLEVAVAGQSPADPFTSYDPVGWPTFSYWPQHDTLTHEQFYWRWLERAYHGGLRLLVNLLVDNTALCQAFPLKRNSCNEMDGVRLQAQRLFELQDYIDAQAGGPGEGFLRIVTSPTQARQVINTGRLAVVLGIEVSELFDCREVLDVPLCSTDDIDARLQEVFDMGVRQMELINKFDNALSGVTGDAGATGVVVNTGNRWVTGHWWDMQTCDDDHDHGHGFSGNEHDKTQPNISDEAPADEIDVLAGAVIELFAPTRGFVAPLYPAGPHCNTRGLTDLGRHLITEMIAKGMIFDPDHMSALGMRQALDHIEHTLIPAERAAAVAEGRPPIQPAVVSSHSWANNVVYQRIFALDGLVAPRTASPAGFVDNWVRHKAWAEQHASPTHIFGLGYGADTNGFGGQPGPRGNAVQRIDYGEGFDAPIGDVRLYQHSSGLRTFDVYTDGVAHYGLFADWFRDLALAADERAAGHGGGSAITADMLRGAEAYIQMWERAVYGANDCVNDQSMPQIEDLHALVGANVEGFLTAVGQPVSRDGSAYVYCADNGGAVPVPTQVVFDDAGVVSEIREFAGAASVAQVLQVSSEQSSGARAGGFGHAHHDHVHAVAAAHHEPTGRGPGPYPVLLLLTGLLWSAVTVRRRLHLTETGGPGR